MTNKKIASVLKDTASLLVLTGGNPFRARAFESAARTLERMEESAEEKLADGTLTQVKGIGDGLAAQILELTERGSFGLRDELLEAIPPGLHDVLRVKGLGAKKVRRLWQELDVTSLETLEEVAQTGRLADLDGFGKKTQENILANIQQLRTYRQRRRYADALAEALPVLEKLRAVPDVQRAELSGELRRNLETVGEARLIAAATDVEAVREALGLEEEAVSTTSEYVLKGALPDGLPLRVRVVPPQRFGTAWWSDTGSETHLQAFKQEAGPPDVHTEEADVFSSAGLAFIPPELREGRGEIEAARDDALPDLLSTDDLRGVLHNHSTYSDGAHSLEAMAEAARQMGFAYFGICDHSQSLTVANGLSPSDVRAQHEEIGRLNTQYAEQSGSPFHVFHGIESDILDDGSLDYSDEILALFDFVVASVHSGFNMSEDEMTERIIRAVTNPFTTILGHATGRLLLAREGYAIDHERVIAACAKHGVAIELNANPYRLDLDWRWVRRATEQGILIAINPDAHSTDQLGYMRWGVAVARKGWLTAAQCLNAKPLPDFTSWLEARKAAV
ncbi:MAG: DNA polymerase/3'-5' exonuclease PolX [Rhodothermales bacterium]